MDLVGLVRKYPVGTAVLCLGLGGALTLLGVRFLGTPWNTERVIEKIVEKPVPAPAPQGAGPRAKEPALGRADLIVMQKNKPLGLDSDFSEDLVDEVRKLPGVERVSEGVVSNANMVGREQIQFLIQGWKPDNFGFEDLTVLEGRVFKEGDEHKVLLGRTLAQNLNKKVGDALTLTADPDHPYEVIGVFRSHVVFEDGGAIVPFKDGQALTGKRVTGFSVRVKKSSPDPTADVEAVRKRIEELRDPNDPGARLDAAAPNGP
jgi:putative ABC transport system permease protein